MPEPNGFNVSLFQRNNAVKNLMCMASQSIENFWRYENIVFRVLFFNQFCPSKKAKTFDWHTSVLSQLECSVCNLHGKNSNPLSPSFPNGQTLNVSKTLSHWEHGMRYLHQRWRSSEKFKREFHIEQIFKIESKTVYEYLKRNNFPWKIVIDWKFIIYFA